jgi:hypothetical protein
VTPRRASLARHSLRVGASLAGERVDSAEIGRYESQGDEHALGGDAANPSASRIVEGGVGAVFDVAVHALGGVAKGSVGEGPLVGAVQERLEELCACLGRERH